MAKAFDEFRFSPFGDGVPTWCFGTAPPTSGNWNLADLVFNSSPSAGQPEGWICVSAGSPGTWAPIGTVNGLSMATLTATAATLSAGTRVFLLNAASGPTIALPLAASYGAGASIVVKNIANNSATVTPLGANGYDAAAITLTQNQTITLISNGATNWYKQA